MANKRIQDLEQTTNLTNDDLLPLDTTKKTFAITLKSLVEWLKRTFQTTANMVNYVKKTGDTMTGTLTNNGVFVSQFDSVNYIARSKTLVKGTTPTNDKYVGYDWQDKNGQRLVYFGVSYKTNGIKVLELQKIDTNLSAFNIFYDISVPKLYVLNGANSINISRGNENYTEIKTMTNKGMRTGGFRNINITDSANKMNECTIYVANDDGTKIASDIAIGKFIGGGTYTRCPMSALNNSIVTTVSHGSNYMRFGNGLQICWGNSAVSQTITLPQPFKDANYKITFCQTDGGEHNINQVSTDKTTTSFRFSIGYTGDWIAIGYWY